MYLIHQDLNPFEREERLTAEATTRAEKTYHRTLTEEEIAIAEKQYAQAGIERKAKEVELKAIQERFKSAIKTLEEQEASYLERISTRKTQVTGMIYGIADHFNNKMLEYDKYGELVGTRDLAPHERQGRLPLERSLPAPGQATNAGPYTDIDHEEVPPGGPAATETDVDAEIDKMYDGPRIATPGTTPAAAEGKPVMVPHSMSEEEADQKYGKFGVDWDWAPTPVHPGTEPKKPVLLPRDTDPEEATAQYGEFGTGWDYESAVHGDAGAPLPGADQPAATPEAEAPQTSGETHHTALTKHTDALNAAVARGDDKPAAGSKKAAPKKTAAPKAEAKTEIPKEIKAGGGKLPRKR